MNYDLSLIASFSITIAVSIGWIRFNNLDPAYFPFLLIVTLALLNEVVSLISIRVFQSNAINYNIYTLLELLLITWQFKKWKLFRNSKRLFFIIQFTCILFWLIENFVWKSVQSFNSYFVIFSSFIIVLMSITMINRLVVKEQEILLKHSAFLICIGLLFYFTYAVIVEAFWVTGFAESKVFINRIYAILVYVNLLANLIYAIAVLWMPTKPNYILPY